MTPDNTCANCGLTKKQHAKSNKAYAQIACLEFKASEETCANCGHDKGLHSKKWGCHEYGCIGKCKEFIPKEAQEPSDIDEICDVCWETKTGCSCNEFTPTGMGIKPSDKESK